MPLVIPAGHAQVIHSLSLVGDKEPMAVTYGVELTGGTPLSLSGVAESLHNAFDLQPNGIPNNAYALESTEVRAGSAAGVVGAVGEFVEKKQSRGTAASLPQNCAVLVHKRSGLPGRRARGRLYLPGISEGVVSVAGQIDAAVVSSFQGIFNQWLASIVAVTTVERMVLLHSTGVSPIIPPTPVVNLVMDPVIATMRRRLR
jgi:hypothetical protein